MRGRGERIGYDGKKGEGRKNGRKEGGTSKM